MEQPAIQTSDIVAQSRQIFSQLVGWSLITMQLAWTIGCAIALAASLLVYGSWGAFTVLVILPYMLVLLLPVDRWLGQLARITRTSGEHRAQVASRSARAVWLGLIAVVILALLFRNFLLGGLVALALMGVGLAYCLRQWRRSDIAQNLVTSLCHPRSSTVDNWLRRPAWGTPSRVWTSRNSNLPYGRATFGVRSRPAAARSVCQAPGCVYSAPGNNTVLGRKHGVLASPKYNLTARFPSRSRIPGALPGQRHKAAITQRLIDYESRNHRVISATRVLTFSPGQIVQQWHIPFWPPFSAPPRVTAQSRNSEFRIKVARVYPYGVRLEVRRPPGEKTSKNTRVSARAVGFP